MQRRSATTRLIVKASRMLQETVGISSDLGCGADMNVSGTTASRVASWRTRAADYRLEFVIVPLRFFDRTKSVMMSGGQECRQTRL